MEAELQSGFQVNQYDNGLTGHVDIAVSTNLASRTYGLNYSQLSNGQYTGGWFNEDNVLSSMKANGHLYYQSRFQPESNDLENSVMNWLNTQVRASTQVGSPGYALSGNNCVDGVNQVLGRFDVPGPAVSYMKANTTAVYQYAMIRQFGSHIPVIIPSFTMFPTPPFGATNVNSLLSLTGNIVTVIG